MENFIKYVNIHNFKSIADLKLEDCRRINLFIGYPNVGKSNVLEALGLFSVPFLRKNESLKKLLRVENHSELFYDFFDDTCEIYTDSKKIKIGIKENLHILLNDKLYYHFTTESKLLRTTPSRNQSNKFSNENNIKRYTFKLNNKWKSYNNEIQLLPPFGENIVDTLSYNTDTDDVKVFIKNEFAKYGLKLLFNKENKSLLISPNTGDDIIFLLPYSSIADTLQRVIFYKTAIASNKNSVLLFEEPEAHAFPPYIANITQDIIDAKTNQFFIVTHSPFVVNDFLEYEHLRRETSIYLFDFKDNQTIARRLTDKEMDEIYEYGIDLFFNIEKFLEEE